MEEIIGHRVHHALRHLRATGAIEVGDGLTLVPPLQRGELGADRVEGRRHWITVPVNCSTHFTTSTWSASSPSA